MLILIKPFLYLLAFGQTAVLFAGVFGLACLLGVTCVRAIAWLPRAATEMLLNAVNSTELAQHEQSPTTQGKMPFVFGMVVLATLLIASPAAHAACRNPKNICKHFDDCLQRTSDPNNKDADGIRAGVKARNGQIVLAGAEACARDLGRKQQWDKWARGCSELEFVQIAKVGLELGKVHCDRYSQ
jgi:hypothetical protein